MYYRGRRVFFERWYERQSKETKEKFKTLVKNGQWEFVGGGWVQNDEANPSAFGIINQVTTRRRCQCRLQIGVLLRAAFASSSSHLSCGSFLLQMTVGHEYLLQNFGVQPRIAWQLVRCLIYLEPCRLCINIYFDLESIFLSLRIHLDIALPHPPCLP